jgi:hypothetical protein
VLAASVAAIALIPSASAGAQTSSRSPAAVPPGGPLTRSNPTPLAPSRYITGAHWLSGRYDPPANQWGDILPTVWSDDGSTYVLMDDGGTDVPVSGGFWRQSFAPNKRTGTGTPTDLSTVLPGSPTPYAIGTEREFNASRLLLGRVRTGVANVTDPRASTARGSTASTSPKSSSRWRAAPRSRLPRRQSGASPTRCARWRSCLARRCPCRCWRCSGGVPAGSAADGRSAAASATFELPEGARPDTGFERLEGIFHTA